MDWEEIRAAVVDALRQSGRSPYRAAVDAGCNPVPDDLWPALAVLRKAHRPKPDERRDPPPLAATLLATAVGSPPDAAAGEGAGAAQPGPAWPEVPDLQTERCVAMEVRGSSMEPTLPDGCRVLVDLADADSAAFLSFAQAAKRWSRAPGPQGTDATCC